MRGSGLQQIARACEPLDQPAGDDEGGCEPADCAEAWRRGKKQHARPRSSFTRVRSQPAISAYFVALG